MSVTLRVLMSITCILNLFYVLFKIRCSKFKISESLYWIFASVMLLILCFFPGIAFAISDFLGFEASINMVYLAILFIMMLKMLSLSMKISELEDRIKRLVQNDAIAEVEKRMVKENESQADDSKDSAGL